MIPGYIACLLLLAGFILLATGWKPFIAPDRSAVSLILMLTLTTCLLFLPAWRMPFQGIVYIQPSAAPLMLAGLGSLFARSAFSGNCYRAAVVGLLSLIWGCLRSLYSYEPFMSWLKPGWDIPVLCGLLVSLLISDFSRQPGLLVWCSILGECFASWLDRGSYYAVIGSARWWDIVLLSFAVAICGNASQALVKAGGLRLGRIFTRLGPKGG
ncbi:YphA family membrane protein [Paenibacillus sp. CAU 1782]